jgi:hypothetical protein
MRFADGRDDAIHIGLAGEAAFIHRPDDIGAVRAATAGVEHRLSLLGDFRRSDWPLSDRKGFAALANFDMGKTGK